MIRRREFLTGAAALAGMTSQAQAFGFGTLGADFSHMGNVLGSVSNWVMAGSPVIDMDLAGGRYFGGTAATLLSATRAQTVTSYATNSDGSLAAFAADTPRIGVGTGLLVEQAATNIILRSQAIANASWIKAKAGVAATPVVTDNAGTAPDGTLTASRVQLSLGGGTTSTDRAQVSQTVTTTSTQTYTVSVYLKSSTASSYNVVVRNTIGSGGQAITVTPTWQRVQFTIVGVGTSISLDVEIRGAQTPVNSDSADFLMWGGQIELGAWASSYVPTTSASATRNADNISAAGALATALAAATASLGVATNSMQLSAASTLLDSNGTIFLGETSGNAVTTALTASLTSGNTGAWNSLTKSFLSWSPSGRSISLNSASAATDATAVTPSAPFHLGSTSGSSAFANGLLARVTVWGSVVSQSFFNVGSSLVAVYAWGDSLTSGVGGGGMTWPLSLSQQYTPNRTVSNQGVPSDTSTQILTRFQALTTSWANPTLIWSGGNDWATPTTVKANIATMISDIGHTNYLVFSILNTNVEPSGSANYIAKMQLNSDLATLYGARFFDVRGMLVAAYDPNIPADVTAHGNDVPPPSLISSYPHLNFAGYQKVGQWVYAKIQALGGW